MAVEAMESFLTRIPLFASLKRKDRERLAEASLLSETEYPPNTILCREGGRSDRLYIIAEGEIEIIKALGTEGHRVLRVCGPGEHVGEMCLLDSGRRSTSLRTRSRVRLLELSKDDFDTLLFRYPYFAWLIAKRMCRRYRDLENNLCSEIQEIKHHLGELLKTAGKSEQDVPGPEGQLLRTEQRESESERSIVWPGVPRLYIRTLGDFQVWRGGSRIGEHEWKGNQPKLLLKAIISRPAAVPKYVLIEELWPEAAPETGEANFKSVLHQLRKNLEPDSPKGFRSSYISLKGSLVTLDRVFCEVDLDSFLSQSERGRVAADRGNLKRAKFFYDAAIELYKGDFLPQDLYTPWITLIREEVRKRYIDLLLRRAELYQNEGNSKKAIECHTRIIEADPLFELSYQRLMLLYSQRGRRAMALRIFGDFTRHLYEDLGTCPDKLTISIYERIAGSSSLYGSGSEGKHPALSLGEEDGFSIQ
ncbi:MAG: BTAD domain-containing putative transcriptional regulator [Syntrophobacteraceae bacterium]|jgi:DNA-binding SARP family transcriptional activator/CRP-like cAMP-binding protein